MKAGDIVLVESGKYRGCALDMVGRDKGGWLVCLNSNEVGGYVRVRRARFYREGLTDAQIDERLDDVLARGYRAKREFVKQVTGAK